MKPQMRLTLMAVLGLVMLLIPISLIYRYESVMKNGRSYKFRIHLVDPYDAFRGRYVSLGYHWLIVDFPESLKTQKGYLWGRLSVDAEGFASFAEIALKPSKNGDWLKVNWNMLGGGKAMVRPVLDRYYMEESLAPRAERALSRTRPMRTDERPSAYVAIRANGRHAAIEQLFVDGTPIVEYLRKNAP